MPRIETKIRTLYKFDELLDDIKEKAVEKLTDINIDHEWWDCTYEDAGTIGLKITSFDLDRNRHAEGAFTQDALKIAHAILEKHGEACETYKTARGFLAEYNKLAIDVPVDYADPETPWPESYEFENQAEDIKNEFLKNILEDYSIILQKEYEYLQSSEAIIETIEANDYEFDAEGNLA